MGRLSRAARETLNSLVDQMDNEKTGPDDVERYVAAKKRIAAAVSAKHPEVSVEQAYEAIALLTTARLYNTTRESKRRLWAHWLQWF